MTKNEVNLFKTNKLNKALIQAQINLNIWEHEVNKLTLEIMNLTTLTLSDVMKCVSLALNISIEQINSRSRVRDIVEARQIYCYIAKKETKQNLKSIGRNIDRDHATVIHSVKNIEALKQFDKGIANKIELVYKKLRQ